MGDEQPFQAPQSCGFVLRLKKLFDTAPKDGDQMPGWTWAATTDRAFQKAWSLADEVTSGSYYHIRSFCITNVEPYHVIAEILIKESAFLPLDTTADDYVASRIEWLLQYDRPGWDEVEQVGEMEDSDMELLVFQKPHDDSEKVDTNETT